MSGRGRGRGSSRGAGRQAGGNDRREQNRRNDLTEREREALRWERNAPRNPPEEELTEEELERLSNSWLGDTVEKRAMRERGRAEIAKWEKATGQKWTGPPPPEYAVHLRSPRIRLQELDEYEAGEWGHPGSRSRPYDGPYQQGQRPQGRRNQKN
ncbi:unnamed protein product [Oikopleura dioica]|uniref:Uncharacterized protein n=1 Tax=Oikopleura dioica TaxID=34765 RepID=E4X7X5_OIKDI|nr:unnamed protein product [Oikopleura dioica]